MYDIIFFVFFFINTSYNICTENIQQDRLYSVHCTYPDPFWVSDPDLRIQIQEKS